MNGVPVLDYKFSRKNTVTIMGGKATVTIDGQKSAIDPDAPIPVSYNSDQGR